MTSSAQIPAIQIDPNASPSDRLMQGLNQGGVPIVAPDGHPGFVHRDALNTFLGRNPGYKTGAVVTAPDGHPGIVPHDAIGAFLKANPTYKLGQATPQTDAVLQDPRMGESRTDMLKRTVVQPFKDEMAPKSAWEEIKRDVVRGLNPLSNPVVQAAGNLVTEGGQKLSDLISKEWEGVPANTTIGKLGKNYLAPAAETAATGVLAPMAQPESIATMGAFKAPVAGTAGRLIRAGTGLVFGVPALRAAVKSGAPAVQAAAQGNTPEAVRLGTQAAFDTAMAAETLGGAAREVPETAKDAITAMSPSRNPSMTKATTKPSVESSLFDRSQAVKQHLQAVADNYKNVVDSKWINLENSIDPALPNGAIDVGALKSKIGSAVDRTVKTNQPIPPALNDIMERSDDPMSWTEARQLRSQLGREVFGDRNLSGEAKAAGKQAYGELTDQMRKAADAVNLGDQFDEANALHKNYINDFVARSSPIARSLKGSNPHQIVGPLSNPATAEQAMRILGNYEGFGADVNALRAEGDKFQSYKSGLPEQLRVHPVEVALDVPGLGSATGARLAYNWMKRAGAMRDLREPMIEQPARTPKVARATIETNPPPSTEPVAPVPQLPPGQYEAPASSLPEQKLLGSGRPVFMQDATVAPTEAPRPAVAPQPEAPNPVVTQSPQPALAAPEAPRMPTGRPLTPEEIAVQQQPGTTGVAKDIGNWQPPPELGAFSAPDYGQKARTEVESKMGGPLKRNTETPKRPFFAKEKAAAAEGRQPERTSASATGKLGALGDVADKNTPLSLKDSIAKLESTRASDPHADKLLKALDTAFESRRGGQFGQYSGRGDVTGAQGAVIEYANAGAAAKEANPSKSQSVPAVEAAVKSQSSPAETPVEASAPAVLTPEQKNKIFVTNGMATRLRDEFIRPETAKAKDDYTLAARRQIPAKRKFYGDLYGKLYREDVAAAIQNVTAAKSTEAPASPTVGSPEYEDLKARVAQLEQKRSGKGIVGVLGKKAEVAPAKPEYLNNGFGPKRTAVPEDTEAIKARIAEPEAKKAKPSSPVPALQAAAKSSPAERFRSMADALDKQIDDKRREMTQNATPKRMAQYRSRIIEADELERTQKALRALADAHEAGNIPPELSGMRSKDEIARMVRKGLSGEGGYYDRIPNRDYHDKSPAGKKLQDMIEGKTPEANAARAEKDRLSKINQAEADAQFRPIPGFFPTPKPLIEKMLSAADIRPGEKVLEPSAGKGDIADAIKQKAPGAEIDTAEINGQLANILKLKGHKLVASDFLSEAFDNDKGKYDKIVMNPPFEKGADVDHVRRAYELLKPGGRLVSIMSPHAEFANDKKSADFRNWLDRVGGSSEKIENGFKGAGVFRQTGVASRMVVIDKE